MSKKDRWCQTKATQAFRQEIIGGPFEQVPLSAVRAEFRVHSTDEKVSYTTWTRLFRSDYSWEPNRGVVIHLETTDRYGDTFTHGCYPSTLSLPRTTESRRTTYAHLCLSCGKPTSRLLMEVAGVYARHSECCGSGVKSVTYRRLVRRMVLRHFTGDRIAARNFYMGPLTRVLAYIGPQKLALSLRDTLEKENEEGADLLGAVLSCIIRPEDDLDESK